MSRSRLLVPCLALCVLSLGAGLFAAGRSQAAPAAPPPRPAPPDTQPAALGMEPASSLAATATVQRTFVSTSGSDSAPCTNAQPCRSFGAAIARTTPGGEVVALSSGGYGPVAIGMAVTIVGAPGVHAAISVASGNGIEVAAGPEDTVVLRNLYLNGMGGNHGIVYGSGRALHLEQVTATGFDAPGAGTGIRHQATNGRLHAVDTILRRNVSGLTVAASGAVATLDRVELRENSDLGIWGAPGTRLRIGDSVVSGNGIGLLSQASTAISRSELSENGYGVYVLSGVTRLVGTTVAHNAYGLFQSGGMLESFGDNAVRGNTTTDVLGIVTPVGKT